MTKEEALNKIGIDTGSPRHEKAIHKAMDEYAKQHILAFIKWTDDEGLFQCGDGVWKSLKPDNHDEFTDEDVYNQFIEQQNK